WLGYTKESRADLIRRATECQLCAVHNGTLKRHKNSLAQVNIAADYKSRANRCKNWVHGSGSFQCLFVGFCVYLFVIVPDFVLRFFPSLVHSLVEEFLNGTVVVILYF